MGFWSVFRRNRGEGETPAPATREAAADGTHPAPQTRELPPEIAKLVHAGLAGGPTGDEAVHLFGMLRHSPAEARTVEELVRVTQTRLLPEPLLLALGAALLDRDESDVAARVLQAATSSPALVVLADLAERRSDFASALSLIERVLLRDLDHPGARERHQRWRGKLGYEVAPKPIAPGATVVTREPDAPFDLLREVGRGGAGAVYEAVDRELQRHVALKVYHQPERDRAQLAHEANVAVALEGPGIVRVFDLDPDHGWIALEWAQHGTLRERVRAKDVGRLLPLERWAVPLASALARVHAGGWVHHDVKPANVLLSRSGEAILTDFGTARRAGEPSPPGSLGYISPERMAGRSSDPRDDIYGFGRILDDALQAAEGGELQPRWSSIAAACTGPDSERPVDGGALLARLRGEIAGR